MKYRMKFRKATKNTLVFETDDPLAPVSQIYLGKGYVALRRQGPNALNVFEVDCEISFPLDEGDPK